MEELEAIKGTQRFHDQHKYCCACHAHVPKLITMIEVANKELVTLRFWREQNLREIKHGREEIKELRERIVEMQESLESHLTAANQKFATHIKHISQFLNDLYCTMIDPLVEGEMQIAPMMIALLDQAEKDREQLSQLTTANAEIERLTQELGIANSGNEVLRDIRLENKDKEIKKLMEDIRLLTDTNTKVSEEITAEREKVEKVMRWVPIMGSSGDYRQGQLDVLENIRQALADGE